jgi:uncharacterized membrane protein
MSALILVLGVLLWSGAHLFKRIAPDARAGMGDKGKGIVAVLSVVAIVLMVIGYRGWDDSAILWNDNPAFKGINNLLMVVALYLYAASGMKTRIGTAMRHPQLTAVVIWSGAHILANGELRSVVLFGGLAVWALLSMVMINAAGPWQRPVAKSSVGKEIGAVVGAVVVAMALGYVHIWFGKSPFGG